MSLLSLVTERGPARRWRALNAPTWLAHPQFVDIHKRMAVASVRAPAADEPPPAGAQTEQTPPSMPPYTRPRGLKAPYTRLSDTLDYLER